MYDERIVAGLGPDSLGPSFRRLARRYGSAPTWQSFIGALLSVPEADVEALAAEPVPATRWEYLDLAARHRIDSRLLQHTVELAIGR